MTKRTKVLITGATGFTGLNFLKKYHLKYDFLIVKRSSSKCLDEKLGIFVNYEDLSEETLKHFSPEILVQLAGKSSFSSSSSSIRDLIRSNIEFPSMITELFVRTGGTKVINCGSYWQHFNNELYNPNSFYAATKQAYEDLLEFYVRDNLLQVISLRLFDSYGPQDPRPKILKLVHEAATRNESLNLTSGNQLIYATHIEDVIDGIEKAFLFFKKGHQKFLLRPNMPLTLRELVDKYLKANNLEASLNWGLRSHTRRDFFSKIDVLPVLPEWSPRISLEEGLKSIY